MSDQLTDIATPEKFAATRRAVVDIGSNSVRLVIYGGYGRAPLTLFNEKVLCGLGRRDLETGNLRDKAISEALHTMQRFRQVLINSGNPPVTVFATAAVREAPNAKSFIDQVKQLGFTPYVLSGEQEARFAATGVMAGTPTVISPKDHRRPHICGDMGGGSLELTRFAPDPDHPFEEMVSLPLGPLNVMAKCGPAIQDAISYVRDMYRQQDWLYTKDTGNLYAVGGAWRMIAAVHMKQENYPLDILHHYEVMAIEAYEICELLEQQDKASLARIPGVQERRVDTLPHAAMALRVLIEEIKPQKLIVSVNGVREGVLFNQLPETEQGQDPFLCLARFYAARYAPDPAFGEACIRFTDTLFEGETSYERRLREAACIMSDIAAFSHPDMRAEQAGDIALRAPFTGIDHTGRWTLASAIYQRYRGKPTELPSRLRGDVLDDKMIALAQQIGTALRFAADFSPKSAQGLADCHFSVFGGKLVFNVPRHAEPLLSETALRALNNLANSFNLKADVAFL